jgi:hypothetical protein
VSAAQTVTTLSETCTRLISTVIFPNSCNLGGYFLGFPPQSTHAAFSRCLFFGPRFSQKGELIDLCRSIFAVAALLVVLTHLRATTVSAGPSYAGMIAHLTVCTFTTCCALPLVLTHLQATTFYTLCCLTMVLTDQDPIDPRARLQQFALGLLTNASVCLECALSVDPVFFLPAVFSMPPLSI